MSTPPYVPEEAMPVGPWVLVVGMHRSGTSAVTGALGQLGLAAPVQSDRWEPSEDNPDHFESVALQLHCNKLLEQLGGTWDRPPDPDFEWDPDLGLALEELGDPAGPARTAFPDSGPVVWKDPRTCLLLPYWLAHLPRPVAAVFIWRSPISVARSLQTRDRLHLADGVALWERYNRCGLAGLAGVDTFITRYESIVENPLGRLRDLATWLGNLPQFAAHARNWDLDAAAARISPQLLREKDSDGSDLLLDEHRQLVEVLHSLDGPNRSLAPPALGGESPWTTALLGDRHQLAVLSIQRDTLRETVRLREWKTQELNARVNALTDDLDRMMGALTDMNELYERMQASTSWRVTRPLRQIASHGGRKGAIAGGVPVSTASQAGLQK
jgi:hypothetical protein